MFRLIWKEVEIVGRTIALQILPQQEVPLSYRPLCVHSTEAGTQQAINKCARERGREKGREGGSKCQHPK